MYTRDMAPGKSSIGPMVRRLRKRHNLTQKTLAKSAGITRAYLNSIEQGRKDDNVSLRVLRSVSDALGVQPYVLLTSETGSRESAVDAALRIGRQLTYMRVLADLERLEAGKFLKSEGLRSPDRQEVRRRLIGLLERLQATAVEAGFRTAHRMLFRRGQKGRPVRRKLAKDVTLPWPGRSTNRSVRVISTVKTRKQSRT
jgi:transcriptional regulator with XRE-family HTH domain